MFCETCGQKLLEGAKFCGACGSKQSEGVMFSQTPETRETTEKSETRETREQMSGEPSPKTDVEPFASTVQSPIQPEVVVQTQPPVQPVQQPVRPVVQPVSQPVQRPAQGQPQHQTTPQQQYATLPYQTAAVLSVWEYLKMFLLLCIPLVNIILMLLWAFNSSENPNKRNYALASLLFFVIMMVVGFVLSILLGGLFMAMFSQMGGYY